MKTQRFPHVLIKKVKKEVNKKWIPHTLGDHWFSTRMHNWNYNNLI